MLQLSLGSALPLSCWHRDAHQSSDAPHEFIAFFQQFLQVESFYASQHKVRSRTAFPFFHLIAWLCTQSCSTGSLS